MRRLLPQRIHLPGTPVQPNVVEMSTCLDAIRDGDPGAARLLYTMYADEIRTFLRRQTGMQAVDNTVFAVLVEAIRAARELQLEDIQALDHTVSELAHQAAFGLRRGVKATNRLNLERRTELVNDLFTALTGSEREIVFRSCVLSQRDDEISRQVELPILQIRKTRAKARVLFRVCCDRATAEHVIAVPN